MAEPGTDLTTSIPDVIDLYSNPVSPVDKSEKIEELRAYLTNLDRINALIFPDEEDERWEIPRVEKHIIKDTPNNVKTIYCKVAYTDGDKAYHTLESLRMHDPMVVAKYAISKDLVHFPEWKWVSNYVETNPVRYAMTQVLNLSVNNEQSSSLV